MDVASIALPKKRRKTKKMAEKVSNGARKCLTVKAKVQGGPKVRRSQGPKVRRSEGPEVALSRSVSLCWKVNIGIVLKFSPSLPGTQSFLVPHEVIGVRFPTTTSFTASHYLRKLLWILLCCCLPTEFPYLALPITQERNKRGYFAALQQTNNP